MKNSHLNFALHHSKDPLSMRFPHPFAYHFEKSSTLGITTGAKYFRGHRIQKKAEAVADVFKVGTSSDKIE